MDEGLRAIRSAFVLERADSELIRDGTVVWRGDRIIAVGPSWKMAQDHPTIRPRDLGECLIMSGLVNAHDHGRALGTLRMGVTDGPLELWLPNLFSQPALPPDIAAHYEGLLQLSVGITTTVHQHNPGDWRNLEAELQATAEGYTKAGLRACIGIPMMDRNMLSYGGSEALFAAMDPADVVAIRSQVSDAPPLGRRDMLDIGRRLADRWKDSGLSWLCWGPVGPQWCSDELLADVREIAKADEPIHIHLAETRRQVVFGLREYGVSPALHLRQLGFLGPDVACAHCVWLDGEDRAALAETGAFAVCNPSSNLRLQSGRADIRALRADGVRLALGLDGQTLNDDQDIWTELRLARSLTAEMGGFGRVKSPETLFDMVGVTAAAATGGPVSGRGEIIAGGAADMIAIDLSAISGPWTSTNVPLIDRVLSRGCPRDVILSIVAGQFRFDGREEIDAKLIAAAEVISQWLAENAGKNTASAAVAKILSRAAANFYKDWEKA